MITLHMGELKLNGETHFFESFHLQGLLLLNKNCYIIKYQGLGQKKHRLDHILHCADTWRQNCKKLKMSSSGKIDLTKCPQKLVKFYALFL